MAARVKSSESGHVWDAVDERDAEVVGILSGRACGAGMK
jgi:hypothetical protein